MSSIQAMLHGPNISRDESAGRKRPRAAELPSALNATKGIKFAGSRTKEAAAETTGDQWSASEYFAARSQKLKEQVRRIELL